MTTDESFINTKIHINIDKPTIQYILNDEEIQFSLDQKYSKLTFDNYYWLINDKLYNSKSPKIPISKSVNLNIQVVVWEENKESNAIGILKKLTLN